MRLVSKNLSIHIKNTVLVGGLLLGSIIGLGQVETAQNKETGSNGKIRLQSYSCQLGIKKLQH